MTQSSLRFGTSGLRGLVSELCGPPAYAYTAAFAKMLKERGAAEAGERVYVGRDLRASSPDIAALAAAAIADAGFKPVDCGVLPTPALAAYAMQNEAPAIMVTGSHIPEDRNGLKFYLPDGEITKSDEAEILRLHAQSPNVLASRSDPLSAPSDIGAVEFYKARYLDFFAPDALKGLKIGVYQHSSVARDLLVDLLSALGAEVRALGRTREFVAIDTEAVRKEDIEHARDWAGEYALDALVSTDGDADRPLIADESGRFIRGDLVGAITALALDADCVVTPVNSNSALEANKLFARVVRTKVGSPFVIEGMAEARRKGARRIVGFEANGGVLLGAAIEGERGLDALQTRDAVLPILSCLGEIVRRGKPLSEIAASLDFRTAMNDRLTHVPREKASAFLTRIADDKPFADQCFAPLGGIASFDQRDGLRLMLGNGEVVHFRGSGNAPEFRVFVEAGDQARATELLAWGLALARKHTGGRLAD